MTSTSIPYHCSFGIMVSCLLLTKKIQNEKYIEVQPVGFKLRYVISI